MGTPSRKRNLGLSNEQDCASQSPRKRCSGEGIQVNDVKRTSWAPKRPTCIQCLKFFGTVDKAGHCSRCYADSKAHAQLKFAAKNASLACRDPNAIRDMEKENKDTDA